MKGQAQLINLLADGKFHSGEAIAKVFGVSRAAVWKKLSKLKAELGLEISAVRGRGYALRVPLNLLSEQKMIEGLSADAKVLLNKMEVHQQILSTNANLMQQAATGEPSGIVCLAEQQSAGRGRLGRQWVSPYGSNLYLSILWRFMLAPADLGGLSLAAGVGVIRSLQEFGVNDISLKWPNDVLYQNKKLAGLLLEMSGEQGGPSHVVLGLGLNVSMSETQGEDIDQPWVGLSAISNDIQVDRNELASSLVSHLFAILQQYETEGLAPLLDEWRAQDHFQGRSVRITIGNRSVDGVHRGVDDAGALLVEVDGKIETYHGGEVSLRSR